MDHDKLDYFKKRLLDEQGLVGDELKSLGVRDERAPGGWEASVGDVDQSATEPDEIADRIEELEENQGEIREISTQARNIQRALTKIEEGTYGLCEMAGETIEEDRLEANPSARTCKAHMGDDGRLTE